MASISSSHSITSNPLDPSSKRLSLAIQEYQQQPQSDQQDKQNPPAQDLPLQRFQKRSLKIKPLRMRKDLIGLRQQHYDKQKMVGELQRINCELRKQYQQCVAQNSKLDSFLKKVEFTFQTDKKKTNTKKVLLQAKKTLLQQGKQAKDRLRKLLKNGDASALKQLKLYITILNQHKSLIADKVKIQQQRVQKRLSIQDFNPSQARKYESACSQIGQWLSEQVKAASHRFKDYRGDLQQIKKRLRIKKVQAKKKQLKDQQQQLKRHLLQQQGLQYEIQLLQQRIKDRKKQGVQQKQLQQKIEIKQTKIIRLQKQVRQKSKTFDYMFQWTKQLKKQFDQRKMQHAKKKAMYDQQITKLTNQYEKYNEDYRNALFKQQEYKRRGPKVIPVASVQVSCVMEKMITAEEVLPIGKKAAFRLLSKQMCPSQVVNNGLNKHSGEMITSVQLGGYIMAITQIGLTREQASKIVRYVVQDQQKTQNSNSISIAYARQVLSNLFKTQIQGPISLRQAQQDLSVFVRAQGSAFRKQLRLLGGASQQVGKEAVLNLFIRMGVFPLQARMYSQYLQYRTWQLNGEIGFVRCGQYQQFARQVKSKAEQS